MSKISRLMRAGAHATLVGAGCLAFSAAAVETAAGPPSPNGFRTVALITGDHVVFSGGTTTIQPRKGREQMSFTIHSEYSAYEQREHTYVIPSDALPLIGAGKLDRELFNVTALSGYSRAGRSDSVPVIVTFQGGQQRSLATASALMAGAPVTQTLITVNGNAHNLNSDQAGQWWDSLASTPAARAAGAAGVGNAIEKVWLDRLVQPALDRSTAAIGAPVAWQSGYTGTGVTVAVIDTGVDATHPDLAGKIVASRNFIADIEPDGTDRIGHGTHVASTILGSGAASQGNYRGVAPGASLISGKVCGLNGCPLSSIIAAMEWAVIEQGARIVNMSLGGPDAPGIDIAEATVNSLSADYDALFVISAGNSGSNAFTVGSPSSADAALSVAALERDNRVAPFSSRGPRMGDRGAKPDISAPGVGIVAARAAQGLIGTPVGDSHVALSGTSMAAPHIAGAAALLLQLHPEWGGQQLKAALMSSARIVPGGVSIFWYGAGMVDVPAAFSARVTADPTTVHLGIARWPHEDDEIMTRAVTYRNSSASPVTLTLQITAAGLSGQMPPPGLLAVAPQTLTIPAGGTATATLTADTRNVQIADIVGARLVATDQSGARAITTIALDHEEESYDLTLQHRDRSGNQPSSYSTDIVPLDRVLPYHPSVLGVPTDVTFRLPAGRYALRYSNHDTDAAGTPDLSYTNILVKPIQILNSDTTVMLDARRTEKLDLRRPVKNAVGVLSVLEIHVPVKAGPLSFWQARGYIGRSLDHYWRVGQLGEHHPDFSWRLNYQWTDGAATDSSRAPALYAALWAENGPLTPARKAVKSKDWAVVEARFGAPIPTLSHGIAVSTPSVLVQSVGAGLTVPLPGKRTEYFYSNDPRTKWRQSVVDPHPVATAPTIRFLDPEIWSYEAGSRHSKRWMEPVLGPMGHAERTGDGLSVVSFLHSDAGGQVGWIEGPVPQDLTLYANGQKVNSFPGAPFARQFMVPAQRTAYRLESSNTQDRSPWSPHVKAVWTFESERTTAATAVPLPAVRFAPNLNRRGQGDCHVSQWVPVEVKNLNGQNPIVVSQLNVEVSYDDGSSWRRVPVKRTGKSWLAWIDHPKRGKHVSLRAATRDPAGTTVEQTIIRAYGLTEQPH